jgi:hypothetical protein
MTAASDLTLPRGVTDWSLMPQLPSRHAPVRYRLRVDGHLDTHWSARFDDLALTLEDNGTTTLTGLLEDQSQLHGLLAKIRDLGLTLISVRVLAETPMDENASTVAAILPPPHRHHDRSTDNTVES